MHRNVFEADIQKNALKCVGVRQMHRNRREILQKDMAFDSQSKFIEN